MAMNLDALKNSPWKDYSQDQLKEIWTRKILNIKKSWHEFEQKKLIVDSMPHRGIVELTQNCNFKCVMCPQSWDEAFKKYHPEYNMPMEIFTKIADEFFPYATFIDLRGFGETTILPYWPDVVDYLQRFPFVEWYLVTNLSMPRDDLWIKMMDLGFLLGFSCDGATKHTFETIRVRSNFDTILHNLEIIDHSIKGHGRGKMHFISTIQSKNIHELRQIVELAKRFSVDEVQFKMIRTDDATMMLEATPPEVVKKNVLQAIDAGVDLGVRVNFNDWMFTKGLTEPENKAKLVKANSIYIKPNSARLPPAPYFERDLWCNEKMPEVFNNIDDSAKVSVHQRCYKPYNYTYINYKAEMGTCNHMMVPVRLMADLSKQSLKEGWNSKAYQEFRKELTTANPTDSRCQWCFKHRMED